MISAKDLIIENNHQFVIVNKPSGLPVQSDLSKDTSLLEIISSFCKHQLHLHSRLDRPVSGIVLLGKKSSAIKSLQKAQNANQILKTYLAIVEGIVEKDLIIKNYLFHDKRVRKSIVSDVEKPDFKLCELKANVYHKFDRYTVLLIELQSGKFHQIRSQLSHAGFPIKGDVKYGARRGNKDRSIDLHGYKIGFNHPVSNTRLNFTADYKNRSGLWEKIDS